MHGRFTRSEAEKCTFLEIFEFPPNFRKNSNFVKFLLGLERKFAHPGLGGTHTAGFHRGFTAVSTNKYIFFTSAFFDQNASHTTISNA
jgi:hypothetical protein